MNRERDERDRKQQPGAASGEQTRTFKALIEKLRKPYEDEKKSPFTECPTSSMYHMGSSLQARAIRRLYWASIAQKDCADELAALAPHYVHKDKLRELRDKWLAYSNTAELSRASCWHACATALTALLEQP